MRSTCCDEAGTNGEFENAPIGSEHGRGQSAKKEWVRQGGARDGAECRGHYPSTEIGLDVDLHLASTPSCIYNENRLRLLSSSSSHPFLLLSAFLIPCALARLWTQRQTPPIQ